jgi:hypothetical protein
MGFSPAVEQFGPVPKREACAVRIGESCHDASNVPACQHYGNQVPLWCT